MRMIIIIIMVIFVDDDDGWWWLMMLLLMRMKIRMRTNWLAAKGQGPGVWWSWSWILVFQHFLDFNDLRFEYFFFPGSLGLVGNIVANPLGTYLYKPFTMTRHILPLFATFQVYFLNISFFLFSPLFLGKASNLTNHIFQIGLGWNHQLEA